LPISKLSIGISGYLSSIFFKTLVLIFDNFAVSDDGIITSNPFPATKSNPGGFDGLFDESIAEYTTDNPTIFNPANVLLATKTVTSVQILDWKNTAVELIAAPGAGKIIDVISLTAKLTYNSVAYTIVGLTALEIKHGSAVLYSNAAATSIISSGSTKYWTAERAPAAALFTNINANTAITAQCTGANPAAGNSTITFSIVYRIITL